MFSAAVSVTVALPLPLDGSMVSQSSPTAIHSVLDVMLTDAVPPFASKDTLVLSMEKVASGSLPGSGSGSGSGSGLLHDIIAAVNAAIANRKRLVFIACVCLWLLFSIC